MTQPLDLYPPRRRMPADRRARIRAILLSTVAESDVDSRRSRRWLAAVSVAAFVLAAALTIAQPWGRATATWAAVPEQLDAAATARLSRACTEAIAQRHFPILLSSTAPVLAEARGTSSAVLSSSPSQVDLCISGATDATERFMGAYFVTPLPAGSLGVVDGVPGSREGGDALRVIFGRLAVPVEAVTVTTGDGLHVTAAVGKGYFLAWWPSHADAVNVSVTLKSGAVQGLTVPAQAPPTPASSVGS